MDSIELLLDEASEQFIRGEWDALQAAGLPSRAAHRSPHNRPHITLLAAPAITGNRDGEVGAALTLPVPFGSAGLVLFPAGRKGYVLARQVVCSAALLQLHHSVHVASDADSPSSTSLPDAWVPHLTLANALTSDQVAVALAVLTTPMTGGHVVAARRWNSRDRTVTLLA